MKCMFLMTRVKKSKSYLYCKMKKKIILFDECKHCSERQYKEYKKIKCKKFGNNCAKPIKGKKHKLTKATEIPMSVKMEVWARDNHKCIYCHKEVPISCANSHYIKRSQLGLGIPQNIVTACPICHDKYDFGINIQDMIDYTKSHLKMHYKCWNEDMLKYKK